MALESSEAAALTGPDTIDCIAPAERWESFWREAAAAKRAAAPWLGTSPSPPGALEPASSEARP
jgi:hypothetical protein